MFNRLAIEKLKNWAKKKDRKPLVLRGARQVGKTTLVEMFSKDFEQYIYFNLELDKDKQVFEESSDIEELTDAIFFLKNKTKKAGKTLLFIDEIQNSPKAVSWLRYFYEDVKHLYVIAAGSLLETLIGNHISFPVGRVEYMPVRPFSYIEFINALGEQQSLSVLNKIPVPDYSHEKLLESFRLYTLIGGMPEVIKNYVENKDINALSPIYDSLITSYKDDVEKYARSRVHINTLRHIIEHAFYEAGSRIKYQGFGNSNYKSREMKEAFFTLEKALLLKLIFPLTSTKIPLQPNIKKSPKLQLLDTGLVNFVTGLQKEVFGSKKLSDVYEGKIAEHIVGQELRALLNSISRDIYFWTREKYSDAEVDFAYQYDNKIIPVEVKSGATGRLRSLHEFIDRADHNFGVRVYAGKLKIDKSRTRNGKDYYLLNLPFYLVHKIDNYLEWFITETGSDSCREMEGGKKV